MSGLERDARALLDDLATADVAVYVEGGKLMRRAGVGSPIPDELRERLRTLRDEVIAILSNQRRGGAGSAPPFVANGVNKGLEAPSRPVTPWLAEDAALMGWLADLDDAGMPAMPFVLRPGETVRGNRFLAELQADAARGARGPRARLGVLQRDAANLREVIERPAKTAAGVDIPRLDAARRATRPLDNRQPVQRRRAASLETK